MPDSTVFWMWVSIVLDSGSFQVLSQPDVCPGRGEISNSAQVEAVPVGYTEPVVTWSDVAVLNCEGNPGIEIIKQVCVTDCANDANWLDADDTNSAPTVAVTVPVSDSAEYRFRVTNTGEITLNNVEVNDPLLFGAGSAPISLGTMAPGEVRDVNQATLEPLGTSTTSAPARVCSPTR